MRGAEAAILTWYVSSKVTALEQQRLPLQNLPVGPLAPAARPGRAVAVPGDEGIHFIA